MARLDEIAEGLASLLKLSHEPEPLGVDLVGYTTVEVAFFIRALVDACERSGVPISVIRVGNTWGLGLAKALGGEGAQYQGIKIEIAAEFQSRIELHRFPIGG